MLLGLMYAAGHGFVVATLGILAISLGVRLPAGTDVLMERLVGVTLVLLGGYVFYTLVKNRDEAFRMKSRVAVLADTLLWAYDRCRTGLAGVQGQRREIFRDGYGGRSSFVVGMIHGIGAETPTQLLLFLVATGLGGASLGVFGVLSFVVGLLVTNTLMCAASIGLYGSAAGRASVYRAVATGTYSLVVGLVFIFGLTNLLPAL
ncbi:MAG: hypothetical protein EXS64_04320 [Candidatus Latescibacteria bacterium]|nr:hypothetical protein [Candidatus Latescibacterota bacterium]